MSKENFLTFDGQIEEVLPEGRFRVLLDNDHRVIAYTAGRMRRNRIRSVAGDRVQVEITPYDLTKGRVVYRGATPRAIGSGQRRTFDVRPVASSTPFLRRSCGMEPRTFRTHRIWSRAAARYPRALARRYLINPARPSPAPSCARSWQNFSADRASVNAMRT